MYIIYNVLAEVIFHRYYDGGCQHSHVSSFSVFSLSVTQVYTCMHIHVHVRVHIGQGCILLLTMMFVRFISLPSFMFVGISLRLTWVGN